MVPKTLSEWTYEVVAQLCEAGRSESERHDFEYLLSEPKKLTKLCCAFANSSGGFVVVGVKERKEKSSFEPVGLDPNTELYGTFLAKVRAAPDIAIPPPLTLPVPGSNRLIYVFEVPESQARPHLPTPADERVFWKRVGASCEQMTIEEIRAQMGSYGEKRGKLMLLLVDLFQKEQALGAEVKLMPGEFTGTIYTFDVIDRIVVETFSLLKSNLEVITKLNLLRALLEDLNASKQKVIAMQSAGVSPDYKRQVADQHRGLASSLQHNVNFLVGDINRIVSEQFGIENPYKVSP